MPVTKTEFRNAMIAERDKTDQPWPDQTVNKYIDAATKIGLDDPCKLSNPAIRAVDPKIGSAEHVTSLVKAGKEVLSRLLNEDKRKEEQKLKTVLPPSLLNVFDSTHSDVKDLIELLKYETALTIHKLVNDTFTDLNRLKSQSISAKENEIVKLNDEIDFLSSSLEEERRTLACVTEESSQAQEAYQKAQEQINGLQADLKQLTSLEKELATLKGKVSAYEAMLEPKAPSRTRNNCAQS
jgi:chromosome segregation ATPase